MPKTDTIKKHVRRYYRDLFAGKYQCHVPLAEGRELALWLDYPEVVLAAVPDNLWRHFLPCGNPLPLLFPVAAGKGLNIGSGAGIDSYALLTLNPKIEQLVNLDVVSKILSHSKHSPIWDHVSNERHLWCCADGDLLPFGSATFDWVLMNGVFNLFPNKTRVLREISRVLKQGGYLLIADLFHYGGLPAYFEQEMDAWAWCMSGAISQKELLRLFDVTGFRVVRDRCEEKTDWFWRGVFLASRG